MISLEALHKVDNHWAILALGDKKRDRGLEVANAVLVNLAVGYQMDLDFKFRKTDDEILDRLAMAYELAAIEGLQAFVNPASEDDELRDQFVAGAWRVFEIRRLFELPDDKEERIFHVLHLSAVAYCGDRWSDLRRWYNENTEEVRAPSVADSPWDRRMIYRLYNCWLRLFRKRGWDDLDRIREIVAGLREDQKSYERGVLDDNSNAKNRAMAFRLIALYHWAKATELLAVYMMRGDPADITSQLEKRFESGIESAGAAHDSTLEVLLRWLYASSRQMVTGSLWRSIRGINSRITRFVENSTKRGLFELLPPQRAALQEQGLLDTANTAIVVDLPTSGGKTLLAQFRILQALNQFDADKGWVAYVTPTRALTAQITRRLRRDLSPIGVRVEQLTGAVEIGTFEEDLLVDKHEERSFDILVSTPEKLQFVIRNKKMKRPLALVVLDEAQNIEDESRGLRIELLLATIKRECRDANFLLLMPYVPNAESLARWLADDINAGKSISLGATPWQPNERIVGMFWAEPDDSERAGWRLKYKTLVTSPKTIHLKGDHRVGSVKPLKLAKSKLIGSGRQKGLGLQAAAMARVMCENGTSIAVANRIDSTWTMARELKKTLTPVRPLPGEIKLAQKFLKTEISEKFELIEMLECGVGVHHAGLSDEVRALIEWLAEENRLRVLCATTTIAQGINFPVSSVFLASPFVPQVGQSVLMSTRSFWNLAGRAGRMGHDNIGVVGLAEGDRADDIKQYVGEKIGNLVSRLVNLVGELKNNQSEDLQAIIHDDQWEDFRCYVAHLWNEKKNLESVLSDTEQLLRNTFGYTVLRNEDSQKASAFLQVTKGYAKKLSDDPGSVRLADATGFSPEGVRAALAGMNQLERKITETDWAPDHLFGGGRELADLFGVMMRIPQLRQLSDMAGEGAEKKHIADIANAWVAGKGIREIAQRYFKNEGDDETRAITAACRAIYRNLVNTGPWGISALSQLSGINFDSLSESERRRLNTVPAMVYYGVKTEEAVLMRMNFAPRSVAEKLGRAYCDTVGSENISLRNAMEFLKSLSIQEWSRVRPPKADLTGGEYKEIWELLSGEGR